MATTQSNLGKVHVFPSETLYNNNKTSVAANDLAFVVDNSSGIVAQSLGTNGYVKFANGLIIQWGKAIANKNSPTTTFPIAFPSTVYRIVSCINPDNKVTDTYNMHELVPENRSLTGFTVWIDNSISTYLDYIAIGK